MPWFFDFNKNAQILQHGSYLGYALFCPLHNNFTLYNKPGRTFWCNILPTCIRNLSLALVMPSGTWISQCAKWSFLSMANISFAWANYTKNVLAMFDSGLVSAINTRFIIRMCLCVLIIISYICKMYILLLYCIMNVCVWRCQNWWLVSIISLTLDPNITYDTSFT